MFLLNEYWDKFYYLKKYNRSKRKKKSKITIGYVMKIALTWERNPLFIPQKLVGYLKEY